MGYLMGSDTHEINFEALFCLRWSSRNDDASNNTKLQLYLL